MGRQSRPKPEGPDVKSAGPRLLNALSEITDDEIAHIVELVAKYPIPMTADEAGAARYVVRTLIRVVAINAQGAESQAHRDR
jgi:hypothetical protein